MAVRPLEEIAVDVGGTFEKAPTNEALEAEAASKELNLESIIALLQRRIAADVVDFAAVAGCYYWRPRPIVATEERRLLRLAAMEAS